MAISRSQQLSIWYSFHRLSDPIVFQLKSVCSHFVQDRHRIQVTRAGNSLSFSETELDSDVEIDLELERKVDKSTQSTPPTPNKKHPSTPTSSQGNLMHLPLSMKAKDRIQILDKLDREHKRRQKSKHKRDRSVQRESKAALHPAAMTEATTQTPSSDVDVDMKLEQLQKLQQELEQGNASEQEPESVTEADTKN